MSSIESRPATMPATRGHLQSRVRALVARHAGVLINRSRSPAPCQRGEDAGTEPPADTRFGSSNATEVRPRV